MLRLRALVLLFSSRDEIHDTDPAGSFKISGQKKPAKR